MTNTDLIELRKGYISEIEHGALTKFNVKLSAMVRVSNAVRAPRDTGK